MKRFFKIFLIALISLITLTAVAVVIAPNFFKSRLIRIVKYEINQRIEGDVDFNDIHVSWWRSFPDVSVRIDALSLTGSKQDTTQNDLLVAKEVALGFDFMSVWSQGDSLEVKSLSLTEPHIFILIDKNGRANYELIASDTTTTVSAGEESEGIKFDLAGYEITGASIRYIDALTGIDISMGNVDHGGDLTYEQNHLYMDVDLLGESLVYRQNNTPYLDNAKVEFDGILDFDLESGRFAFRDNDLFINALQLYFDGFIELQDEDILFDVRLATRDNTFERVLSILPNMYTEQFDQVETRGKFDLSGGVLGTYSVESGSYPVYELDVSIDNGWFRMPDQSLPISDINLKGHLKNTANKISPSVIRIPSFNFILNNERIAGHVDIENRSDNQFFDGALKGKVNMEELHRAYPFPDINSMAGKVDFDLSFKGNTTAVSEGNPEQLEYNGFIRGDAIRVEMTGQPKISLEEIRANLNNEMVEVNSIRGKVGESDFNGSVRLSPASYFFSDDVSPLDVKIRATGKRLDLDEIMGDDESADDNTLSDPGESTAPSDLLKEITFDIQGSYDRIIFSPHEFGSVRTHAYGSLNRLEIKQFSGTLDGDPISLSGKLNHVYDYLFAEGTVSGDMKVEATSFNVNDWMSESDGNGSESTSDNVSDEYVAVPERIDINMQAAVDQLVYDDIEIKNLSGRIVVKERRVLISGLEGNGLGGSFALDGYYEYDGSNEPLFKLAYDIQNFSFEETFRNVESAQFLMPVISKIQGSFNSDMAFEGSLGAGFMPNLKSLSGQGLLETMHARIANSESLNRIAGLLGIDDLKKLNLDRSRNRFSVEDGTLTLEPFEKSIDDINARISGSHKLTGDMNYRMALTVPTEKFNAKGIPVDIKEQFSKVQKQLQKFGLPLEDTESIRVDVVLTGDIGSPKINVQLVDFSKASVEDAVKELAKNVAEQAKDSVRNVANKEALKLIQGENADSTQTSVTEAAKDRVKDEVNKKIEEEVKPVSDSVMAEAKKKLEEELKDAVDEDTRNKAKELLEDLNPFKKKKKKEGD